MVHNIDLKYIGVCNAGPWKGQEVRAEMPVIREGLPCGAQYFHENGCWYWEPDYDSVFSKPEESGNGA